MSARFRKISTNLNGFNTSFQFVYKAVSVTELFKQNASFNQKHKSNHADYQKFSKATVLKLTKGFGITFRNGMLIRSLQIHGYQYHSHQHCPHFSQYSPEVSVIVEVEVFVLQSVVYLCGF